MANIEEKTDRFDGLYQKIKKLGAWGNNSVVRRILAMVRDEFEIEEKALCNPCGCKPVNCTPAFLPQEKKEDASGTNESFSTEAAFREFQADDRRRSVFLNPSEAYLASLLDFYTGRLDVVEFRDSGMKLNYEILNEEALEKFRRVAPLVIVNEVLAESPEEIIIVLQEFLKIYEARIAESNTIDIRASKESSVDKYNDQMVTYLKGEECSSLRWEQRESRWINEGKTLQHRFQEILQCCTGDSCCGNNPICRTQNGKSEWRTTWDSATNPNTPPPITPPKYTPRPWHNDPWQVLDTDGTLTSVYGWRNLEGQSNFHQGIDIAAPVGTGVKSATQGIIVHINSAGYEGGVIVQNGNRTYSYWHIDPAQGLSINQQVNAGANIGAIAGGGQAHLDFKIHEPPGGDWHQRDKNNSINPLH